MSSYAADETTNLVKVSPLVTGLFSYDKNKLP